MRSLLAAASVLAWGCASPPAGARGAPSASGVASAPAPAPAPTLIAVLERHVAALCALDGRKAGSPDEQKAAEYGARVLAEIGVEPHGTMALGALGTFADEVPVGGGTSRNVVGRIKAAAARRPGVIVLGAHVDHLGKQGGVVYPGADDNASGVAAVLEVARRLVLRKAELERDVVVVLFGAEEIGLVGSRAFVRDRAKSLPTFVMINVDMFGRPLLDHPAAALFRWSFGVAPVGLTGTRNRPMLEKAIEDGLNTKGHHAVTPEHLPRALQPMVEEMARARSDDWPFEQAGIPAVFLSSSLSSDYHEPGDTPDRLDLRLLEERTLALVEIVIRVARLEKV